MRSWNILKRIIIIPVLLMCFLSKPLISTSQINGSDLWFSQNKLLEANKNLKPTFIIPLEYGGTFELAVNELNSGLTKIYGCPIANKKKLTSGSLVLALGENPFVKSVIDENELSTLNEDGFIIRYIPSKDITIITGNSEVAILYAVFKYLRLLQTIELNLKTLNVIEVPDYQRRVLNHWDNLDGSVERGYAGHSIWEWDKLPQKVSSRYKEYARANASIGINGTVLNNVNANPQILLNEYLQKVKVIADEIRPYGVRVYLSVNFASPSVLGNIETSNPKNDTVVLWWKKKVEEIYNLIPDFGGFLVKANSEGQPGPMDFGCTHAEGANMLADALKPYNGIVMWRAFVYNPKSDDRAKQAFDEFMPLDGKFRDNVMVQVKNGPIDFQPREPINPLFGAMKNTTLMPELQITQEYLGFSDHLVYLGTLYKEFLNSDTYSNGKGSSLVSIIDSQKHERLSGIAGVANIGLDTNWCGHLFAQSNWYVFGRLAWETNLNVRDIAKEWVMQTLTHEKKAVDNIVSIMMRSREATVNYMTPLGLHHLMGWGHHYGPEPWCKEEGARPDWLPSYYHKADSIGIGFNRSSTGSKAVKQYAEPICSYFDNPALCAPEYLLWFHHLPWDYELNNGHTLWEELCFRYQFGVDEVSDFKKTWSTLSESVDDQSFKEVNEKLTIHLKEAIWWKDACLLYFQTFSKMPFPEGIDRPVHKLKDLKKLKFDMPHHN
jgi:alpha-glucuronidase